MDFPAEFAEYTEEFFLGIPRGLRDFLEHVGVELLRKNSLIQNAFAVKAYRYEKYV